MLLDDHAAEQVLNAKELAENVTKCFRDVEHRHLMAEAGRRVLADTRSTFGKLMKSWIDIVQCYHSGLIIPGIPDRSTNESISKKAR